MTMTMAHERELYPAGEPDYAVPPGETLLEVLEDQDMSQRELARRTGLTPKHINQLVRGFASLSYDMAERLERVTGIPARLWNSLETNYRSTQERLRQQRDLAHYEPWVREMPANDLVKRSHLPEKPKDKTLLVEQLLTFFGVANLDAWQELYGNPAAAFRKSAAYEVKQAAVATWLRLGELAAQEVDCARFNSSGLERDLPQLRALTTMPPSGFIPRMRDMCARNGVVLVFVDDVLGARSSGVTRKLGATMLIQVSSRYKTDDQLWFTFFHEVCHVLRHGNDIRIEDSQNTPDDPKEHEANEFARDLLIPPEVTQRFPTLNSKAAVKAFAQEIGIAPSIVIGRLQHEGRWQRQSGNDLKQRFDLSDYTP